VLEVAGQRVTGDVAVSRTTAGTTLEVGGASLSLAGGLATVTGASLSLTTTETGAYGRFSGTLALSVPGISTTATVTGEIDTRPGGAVLITGSAVSVVVAGVTLTGGFTFTRVGDIVTVDLVGVTVTGLGDLSVSGITGQLVLAGDGVAGSISGTVSSTLLGLTSASALVQVNTRPAAAVLSSTVTLPAGPYTRVVVTVTGWTLGAGNTVSGTVAVQSSVPGT
jgi:hypothetical protein